MLRQRELAAHTAAEKSNNQLYGRSEQQSEYLVGVDLGGTKILAGIFTTSLKCVGRSKMSTKAERGPEAVIERIAHCVQDAVDECDLSLKQVRGVGIGAPGLGGPGERQGDVRRQSRLEGYSAQKGSGKPSGGAGFLAERLQCLHARRA